MTIPSNKRLGYSAVSNLFESVFFAFIAIYFGAGRILTNVKVGACLGVSIYKKFDFRTSNGYIKPIGIDLNPYYVVNGYYNTLASSITSILSFNFKLVNLCLIGIFLLTNFVIWVVFGRLTSNEIRNLKDKISYTAWEFCLGFLIFYYSTIRNDEIATNDLLVRHELLKYGGLFLCVFLLKCFHYLSVGRVYTTASNVHDATTLKFQYLRFSIGLAVLNLVDVMLINKYFQEIISSYSGNSKVSFKDNILITIFGFEILHIFPLIILTTVKYALNCFELFKFGTLDNLEFDSSNAESVKWDDTKLKIIYTCEFLVNLIRFGIGCIFSILFMYFYTFPFHILPSSYLSLRLLVLKARCLLDFRMKNFQMQKLITPRKVGSFEKCIICFDDLSHGLLDDVRVLKNCSHQFHYNCLKNWVNYSSTCPICRKKL